jgi:HEAT repeat protein
VADGDEVVFTDVCEWTPRKGEQLDPPVIRDYRRIAVRAPDAASRVVDFTIVLVPLTDVTITKTNHSLFALRMEPALSAQSGGTMVDAAGRSGEKATFGQLAPWMDCFGSRDGVVEGAAILQHPANRWYPSPWFTRDYGFFSPTPMQWLEKPLVLKKGESVTLAYRVVVHAGGTTEADIAGRFATFAEERPVLPEPFITMRVNEAIPQLAAVRSYELGQSRKPLFAVERVVALLSGERVAGRHDFAGLLGIILAERDTTATGRRFLCRQLGLLGGEQAIEALASQLGNEDGHVAETAVLSLGQIGSPPAAEVLANALPEMAGRLRQTAVGCLGEMGDSARPTLSSLLADTDPVCRALAARGLARIGGPEAVQALYQALPEAPRDEQGTIIQAVVEAMDATGDPLPDTYARICRSLLTTATPVACRPGILGVALRALPADEIRAAYAQALGSTEPMLRLDALARVATVGDGGLVESAASRLSGLAGDEKVVLLRALGSRGDGEFAGVARAALGETDASVIDAACATLGRLGDASDVPALLAKAGTKSATEALAGMSGPEVSSAIGSAMVQADGKAREELVDLLVRRGEAAGAPWLLKVARDDDRTVRKTALKGLGTLGGPAQRDAILAMLSEDLGSASNRQPYEACAGALLRRLPGGDGASQTCLARMDGATPDGKASLLRVLGTLGEPAGLQALTLATKDRDAGIRDAAIRALADWPTSDALAPLLAVAQRTDELTQNVLALRGCRRLLPLMADADAEVLEKAYADCRAAARRDEERSLFAYNPEGMAIGNLSAKAGGTYRIRRAGLRKGALWATDREYTFTEIPPQLVGATYIETVMNHRSVSDAPDFLSFHVSEPATVIVGFDNRCQKLPDWLKTWEKTGMILRTTTDTCHLVGYRKSFPAGAVSVGGAKAPGVAAMYTVVVLPKTE